MDESPKVQITHYSKVEILQSTKYLDLCLKIEKSKYHSTRGGKKEKQK